MEQGHLCNLNALSLFCYQCSTNICSKCAKTVHKDHPASTVVDYKAILKTHCTILASAHNLKGLSQLKQEVNIIIDSYILKYQKAMGKLEKDITGVLVQGNTGIHVAPKLIPRAKDASLLSTEINKVIKDIGASVSIIIENSVKCTSIKNNGILADETVIASLKAKYYETSYPYRRAVNGPLASIMKKLALSKGIQIWTDKGIYLFSKYYI